MSSIPIDHLIQALDLNVIYEGKAKSVDIGTSDINRPGLQFAGFFDYFAKERIQVIGKVEMTFYRFRHSLSDYFTEHGYSPIPAGLRQEIWLSHSPVQKSYHETDS